MDQQTDFTSMTSAQLRAEIAAGNLPPIAGADDGTVAPPPAAAAPAEPAPAPPAQPEPVESIAQISERVRAEQAAAAEAPPEPTPPAEPAPADPPPAEEPPADEPPAEEPEQQENTYSREEVQLAMDIVRNQPDHEQYDVAVAILDDLGLIEHDDPTAEGEPTEYDDETPQEREIRELRERLDARDQADAEAARRDEEQKVDNEFFGDLTKTFSPEGEAFPRDPDDWTPLQSAQARLTASLGSAEAAKEVLTQLNKDAIDGYINTKPDPNAADSPLTDRTAAAVPEPVDPAADKPFRANLREISQQHSQAARDAAQSA